MNFIHLSSASAGIDACQKRRKYMKRNPEMRPRTETCVMNFIHLTSASAGINACPKRRKHVKIKPETILRQKNFRIKICEKKNP